MVKTPFPEEPISSKRVSGGLVALPVIVSVILIAVMGFVIYRKKRRYILFISCALRLTLHAIQRGVVEKGGREKVYSVVQMILECPRLTRVYKVLTNKASFGLEINLFCRINYFFHFLARV